MKLQLEQFVFLVIMALLALFLYTWAFCFDLPGHKEGVKRWDLIKKKLKEKIKAKKVKVNAPRLCVVCSKKVKRPRMVVLVNTVDCSICGLTGAHR